MKSLFGEFEFLVEMKLGCPRALILSGMAMANFWDAVNAPFMHLGILWPHTHPSSGAYQVAFAFFRPLVPCDGAGGVF